MADVQPHTEPTATELIREWEDEDENDGEWPYPTQYRESRVLGGLADRVRIAFYAPADAEVLIEEREISGGVVVILRLRTGETVAVFGPADPRSASFVLLQRDPGEPAEIIDHFRALTGFRPADVTGL